MVTRPWSSRGRCALVMERQGVVLTAVVCPRTGHDRWPWSGVGDLEFWPGSCDLGVVTIREWELCLYIHCNFAITKFVIGVFHLGIFVRGRSANKTAIELNKSQHHQRSARKHTRSGLGSLESKHYWLLDFFCRSLTSSDFFEKTRARPFSSLELFVLFLRCASRPAGPPWHIRIE